MRWEKASPSWRVMADTVLAGLLGTGMAWGQAQWRQGARRAEAVEAAFPIHTGAALPAGTGRTLVDLHVAERPWGAHRQPQPQARTTQPTEGDALEQGHSPSHNTSALLQTGAATSSAQSCPAPRSSSSPNLHEGIFIFTEDHVGPTQKHPAPSEQPYLRSRINLSQYGDDFVTNRETITRGQSHWPSQCKERGKTRPSRMGGFTLTLSGPLPMAAPCPPVKPGWQTQS